MLFWVLEFQMKGCISCLSSAAVRSCVPTVYPTRFEPRRAGSFTLSSSVITVTCRFVRNAPADSVTFSTTNIQRRTSPDNQRKRKLWSHFRTMVRLWCAGNTPERESFRRCSSCIFRTMNESTWIRETKTMTCRAHSSTTRPESRPIPNQ